MRTVIPNRLYCVFIHLFSYELFPDERQILEDLQHAQSTLAYDGPLPPRTLTGGDRSLRYPDLVVPFVKPLTVVDPFPSHIGLRASSVPGHMLIAPRAVRRPRGQANMYTHKS